MTVNCLLRVVLQRSLLSGRLVGLLFLAVAMASCFLMSMANANAADLFAGVTKIIAMPLAGNTQVISVESDLPFEYQQIVVNPNQIILRFLNAKLSEDLQQGNGELVLSANGSAIKSIRSYLGDSQPANATLLLLTGENLASMNLVLEDMAQTPLRKTAIAETEKNALLKQTKTATTETAPVSGGVQRPEVPNRAAAIAILHALDQYQQARYDESERTLKQVLLDNPRNAALYAALGELQIDRNRYEDAEKTYQKAYTYDSKTHAIRYAETLALLKRRQEAIAVLEKVYASKKPAPQADGADWGKVLYMLGTLYEETGDTRKALLYLKEAAGHDPANADIQYNLGVAYELLGDLKLAKTHYQNAAQLSPQATDVNRALARIAKS